MTETLRAHGAETGTSTLRTSSYTIYVDLPDTADEVLLVHGYSGAYDVVSAGVANAVRALESRQPPRPLYGQWSPEPPREGPVESLSEATLTRLRRRGYVTDMTEDEEERYFVEFVEAMHSSSRAGRPVILFMPTYDCNLRCSYCFQDHMRTDERFGHLLRTMSRQTADALVAALPEIEARHGISDPAETGQSITFFGGEPLLAQSRPIVEYLMTRVRDRAPADFSAVTNGTELEAYADLLGGDGITSLQITLDGPPERHDTRRIYADGAGSFERIAGNIDLALERGAHVEVRTNVDRTNVDDLPALADEIVRRGWHRNPHFTAYTAVVTATNEKTARRTTFSSWQLDKKLTELREEHPTLHVLGRPDDGLIRRIREIVDGRQSPFGSFTASYCAAHAGMYVFDAFGSIYACWERTGDEAARIGWVAPDGRVSWRGLRQVWHQRTVASNPVCRQCRFALYCGGGCAVNAVRQTGEFFSSYCDGFAARFRASAAEALVGVRSNTEPAGTGEQGRRIC